MLMSSLLSHFNDLRISLFSNVKMQNVVGNPQGLCVSENPVGSAQGYTNFMILADADRIQSPSCVLEIDQPF